MKKTFYAFAGIAVILIFVIVERRSDEKDILFVQSRDAGTEG